MSQQPRRIVDPIQIEECAPADLELMDVFDFFNYPHLPNKNSSLDLTVGDPSSNAPFTARNNAATTRFSVPNPESDWLIFKPPHD